MHRMTLGVTLLLLLGILAVFAPVLTYDFVAWDDDIHVYDNPRLHPVTWTQVAAFWRAPYEHLYIPLTYTVWAALVWLSTSGLTMPEGSLDATLFHRLNLLLHLGSTLLVWRLGGRLMERSAPRELAEIHVAPLAAGIGALCFAIHPLQVEAVAWVSGLKDVLCGFLALGALWQYQKVVDAPERRRRCWHYCLATGAFMLALMAKPAAVVVPLVAYVLYGRHHRMAWRSTLSFLGPWVGGAILWGWWTMVQQPGTALEFVTPLWLRPIIATDAVAFYLQKLLWPFQFGPDYGRTPQVVLMQGGRLLLGLLACGLIVLGVWQKRAQLPGLVVALEVFLASLLPVLGLIPFHFQAHSTVADRYAYLAMLGPALGIGWLLGRGGQGRGRWLVAALGLALLAWQGVRQVHVWPNTIALFTHTLQVNPRSALAHNNLGWALAQQGQYATAIQHYQQALQIRPDAVYTHNNLGLALANQGQIDAAIAHYTTALRLQPAYTNARNNLGLLLVRQGQFDAAMAHFSQALATAPNDPKTRNHLGIAFAAQGKFVEAMTQFTQAIQSQPTYAKAYHNLGLALSHLGRAPEALLALRTAHQLLPAWPQAASSLARALLDQQPHTSPLLAEARALAAQAARQTAYQDAPILYTLALVEQAAGNTSRARSNAQQARQLADTAGDTVLAAQILAQFSPLDAEEAPHGSP